MRSGVSVAKIQESAGVSLATAYRRYGKYLRGGLTAEQVLRPSWQYLDKRPKRPAPRRGPNASWGNPTAEYLALSDEERSPEIRPIGTWERAMLESAP